MSETVTEDLELGTLGTNWALTQFSARGDYAITTYKTGHYFRGEKQAKKLLPELGELGTGWALTQLRELGALYIKSCETGQWFQLGKEAS